MSNKNRVAKAARVMMSQLLLRVCERVKRERPHVPLLTRGTAVGTVPEHAAYLNAVVRDEFAKLGVDFQPGRKVYN